MDLEDRIERRNAGLGDRQLVRDYRAISPIAHVDEPTGRGPVLERLLDHLEPVFEGRLPPNAYVYGPAGAGKSAVVTALFAKLDEFASARQSVILTSTRQPTTSTPRFVYLDLRETTSDFAFYHAVLDAISDEPVPRHGISTENIRRQLHDALSDRSTGAVVAIDHVGDSDEVDVDRLLSLVAGLPSKTSWLAVARSTPDQTPLTSYTATDVSVDPYGRQALVDIVMARASRGLARQALGHEQARRIADWAAGDAHDALTVLFVAATEAEADDCDRIEAEHVTAAIEALPPDPVSLDRVLALPTNKQATVRALIDLPEPERGPVTATADAIADRIDLSAGTIERFLYELAEEGIVERVRLDDGSGKGRPPSSVELRFSAAAFRQLYDRRHVE